MPGKHGGRAASVSGGIYGGKKRKGSKRKGSKKRKRSKSRKSGGSKK